MTQPTFIEIDGRRFVWRDLVEKRREQLKATAKAVQPALFELRDDSRPAWGHRRIFPKEHVKQLAS